MISSLRGTVIALMAGSAVIEVGGVGLQVFATTSALAKLHQGSEALLHTHLVVKEDSLTLYGFHSLEEKEVFEVLLGVSGIGAKIALAALNTYDANTLRQIVAQKNEKAITQIPGIGPKVAKRILLEIGDKLGPALSEATPVAPAESATTETVIAALVGLGWREAEAGEAVNLALQQLPTGTTQELLRTALQIFGSRR